METLGAIIAWAFFGLIVGLIARFLVPGRQAMGMVMTMVLGVVGSLVGGFLSWVFTGGPEEPFHPAGWIMSILGAILLVWIFGATSRGARAYDTRARRRGFDVIGSTMQSTPSRFAAARCMDLNRGNAGR
jgi:uncharacterized membrane protein YeaQ/YmgE (transglycosylase-associated protein family)